MHIFVINLEKDIARRESISRQFEELGLDYEIITGVYGASLSSEERLRDYNDRKALWLRSRPLVNAEIGCALSHIKVYKAMVERGIESALILEDDVILPPNLKLFLDEVENKLDTKQASVWLLSPAEGFNVTEVSISIDQTYSLRPYKTGFYTSSYLLTLSAAQALLKELYPVSDVADCWLRMQRYKVVDLFAIDPPLIEQDQDTFGSSTTSDIQKAIKTDYCSKVIYKARRVRSVLWESIYSRYRKNCRPYAGIDFK